MSAIERCPPFRGRVCMNIGLSQTKLTVRDQCGARSIRGRLFILVSFGPSEQSKIESSLYYRGRDYMNFGLLWTCKLSVIERSSYLIDVEMI